jgi:hypothetical protein
VALAQSELDVDVSVEKVETLIVGGGQAGLAMSGQLSKRGLSHLVSGTASDCRTLALGKVGRFARQRSRLA